MTSEKENGVNELINGGLSWGKLIAFTVVIISSSFSTVLVRDNIIPPRPDPFTGTAAEILKLQIERDLNNIRFSMPPKKTRDRIRAIEKWIQKKDLEYVVPTDDWGITNDNNDSNT